MPPNKKPDSSRKIKRNLELDKVPPEDPFPFKPVASSKPKGSKRPAREREAEVEPSPGLIAEYWGLFKEIASEPWHPVSKVSFISVSVLFAWLTYLLATDPQMRNSKFLNFIHGVNLVFHEFGHPFFGLFGEVIGILGGTLGQLMIPLIIVIAFWRQRDAVGFSICLFWFFENFLDIAIYMADARALQLQLIGGLGREAHDWRNLFLEWGVIRSDLQIAAATRALGWIGMVGIWLWLAWRWLTSDQRTRG